MTKPVYQESFSYDMIISQYQPKSRFESDTPIDNLKFEYSFGMATITFANIPNNPYYCTHLLTIKTERGEIIIDQIDYKSSSYQINVEGFEMWKLSKNVFDTIFKTDFITERNGIFYKVKPLEREYLYEDIDYRLQGLKSYCLANLENTEQEEVIKTIFGFNWGEINEVPFYQLMNFIKIDPEDAIAKISKTVPEIKTDHYHYVANIAKKDNGIYSTQLTPLFDLQHLPNWIASKSILQGKFELNRETMNLHFNMHRTK